MVRPGQQGRLANPACARIKTLAQRGSAELPTQTLNVLLRHPKSSVAITQTRCCTFSLDGNLGSVHSHFSQLELETEVVFQARIPRRDVARHGRFHPASLGPNAVTIAGTGLQYQL